MIARLLLILMLAVAAPAPTGADPSLTITAKPVERAIPMMINLAPLVDWGTQQPFINRMKTARKWIGHLPGQWGGLTHDDLIARGLLDAQGWPTALPRDLNAIGTLIMTDLPETALSLAGRYVLEFEGTGIVEVAGRAQNVRYGKNRVTFDFSPGPGGIDLRIQRSDPRGTGDYVRHITVMRADRVALYQQGQIFNPDFLTLLQGFQGLRFMEWMLTNNATLSDWTNRAKPGDFSYTWRGIPFEVIADLANTTRTDPWVTLPHKATDLYFRYSANMMRDLVHPDLTVHVEYSNEVWNWGFSQAAWADEQALTRWGVEHQWQQFYGMRAAQMAQIWRDVFRDDPDRLRTVLSTQAGWLGLEDQLLHAPLWQEEDDGNAPPYTYFDSYAITGYMSAALGYPDRARMIHDWIRDSESRAIADAQAQGLTGAARQAYVDNTRYARAIEKAAAEVMDGRVSGHRDSSLRDLLDRIFPHHSAVARRHGLELIMYEGGTHVVGIGPALDDEALTAFFHAFNYSPEMAVLYSHLLTGWADITDGAFNVFNDIAPASKWGSFGAKQHYDDDNPRWQTIRAFRDGPGGQVWRTR